MTKKTKPEVNVLEIDPDALDQEWLKQPGLYFEFAEQLADARRKLDRAKSALDVVAADLDKCIREDPQQFDLEKITEAQVTKTVLVQDEYQEALKEVQNANYRVNLIQAMVTALDHRKKALENFVFLHGQNYFSEPRARGEEAQEYVGQQRKRRTRTRRTTS